MFWDHWKTNTSLGAFSARCELHCWLGPESEAKFSRLKSEWKRERKKSWEKWFDYCFQKVIQWFIVTGCISTVPIFNCKSGNIVVLYLMCTYLCMCLLPCTCRWRWITRLPQEQGPTRRWPSGTRPRRCSCSWDTRPPQFLRAPLRYELYF